MVGKEWEEKGRGGDGKMRELTSYLMHLSANGDLDKMKAHLRQVL